MSNQGETIFVKVRGFNAISGGGDYGEVVYLKATRPVDTANSSNLINNGDFEAGLAYWGGLRYVGSGPVYTLLTTIDPGIDGASLRMLGQPSQIVNILSSNKAIL